MNNDKNAKHIQREKEKYAKIINNSEGKLLPAFYRASQKGDLDILQDFIMECEGVTQFCNEAWDSLGPNTQKKETLIDFTCDLGIEELKKKFGENFNQRIQQLYSNGKVDIQDIRKLVLLDADREQSDSIIELVNLFANKQLKVGFHRTGNDNLGEDICKKGLYLTGDLSSGIENQNATLNNLSNNIEFSDHPGLAVSQIANGGRYKNLLGKEHIDIAIVAIPKDDLNGFKDDVIIHEGQPTLNPRYVYGYAKVNSITDKFESLTRNDRYADYNISDSSRNNQLNNDYRTKEIEGYEDR